MNAIGPVEPGEDTYGPEGTPAPPVRVAPHRLRRRRGTLAAGAALLVAAAGLSLYLTRPQPPPPPPAPYPSQSVSVTYTGRMSHPRPGDRSFTFTVAFAQESGPPVTVRRVGQPSAALSVGTSPVAPFEVKSGPPRTSIVRMRIHTCRGVPRNAGLPFLEVTLRNTRAMEKQSYILGPEYANDLSRALTAACPRTPLS
ncbi:Tat pathway signal sequence domain protein [Streptomyces sp. NPDC047123]|uniref:Tat pathway signal sequence domain protein n=1 Tax=Streptomyces sp. NPDC047123 TaxID=3155622 RepID=UPI003407E733